MIKVRRVAGFLIVVLLLSAQAADAANPPGGKGLAQTKDGPPNWICTDVSDQSKYLERICIDKVQAKWRANLLGGEAVTFAEVRWTLWAGADSDFDEVGVLQGKGGGDLRYHIHLLNAPNFLLEALRNLSITDMNIRAAIEPLFPTVAEGDDRDEAERQRSEYEYFSFHYRGSQRLYMNLDAGALAGPGKYSYNTPTILPWDKLFDKVQNCPVGHHQFLEEDQAKKLFELGFRISRLDICGFTLTGLSSVDYALEKSCLAWNDNSEKYHECRAQCPEGMWLNTGDNSKHASCTYQPPLNFAKPPRPKSKEDIAFEKELEKELIAAADVKIPSLASLSKPSSQKASPQQSLQNNLMAALQTGRTGSGASTSSAGSGKAPYGLQPAQWSKILAEREAERAALDVRKENDTQACHGGKPERPEEPSLQLLTLWPNECDADCRRRGQANIDRRNEEKIRDHRRAVERYERRVEEWAEAREKCFEQVKKDHKKRLQELAKIHEDDNDRLANIYSFQKQLNAPPQSNSQTQSPGPLQPTGQPQPPKKKNP